MSLTINLNSPSRLKEEALHEAYEAAGEDALLAHKTWMATAEWQTYDEAWRVQKQALEIAEATPEYKAYIIACNAQDDIDKDILEAMRERMRNERR